MIGVLIVSHGLLAAELLKTAEKIVGPQEQVKVLSTSGRKQRHQLRDEVKTLIDSLDTGEGVLVMTDCPGGTPANISLDAARGERNVRVLCGINLPMLLTLVERLQGKTIDEIAASALSAGKATVCDLTDMMKARASESKDSKPQ
ncbi:MAG: PTS mannose transporter subunit IIC [Candidatus Coatesbacteria bacterium]|nr:PTS mannose transporter subunit IIC [Candidatus Coatesbacteria bacterium]